MKYPVLGRVLRFLVRAWYRIHPIHPENLPSTGGALVVSNHISFVDVLLILAGTRRFVRFLIAEEICGIWWLRPFLNHLGVIPLPTESKTRELNQALEQARQCIRDGQVIGIFAERSITRIGSLLPFRREFEQMMQGTDAPVIPVCLDGVWGSIFSYERGKFFWKLPRRFRSPVSVSFGKPMPNTSTAFEVRSAIQELNTDAWHVRRERIRPIHRAFVRRARRHPFRFAMADGRVPKMGLFAALSKVIFLGRRLRAHWQDQEMVGLLLPPSVPGALVNHAALLMGKVPVNLNYTLGEEAFASCVTQCSLQTVLTSKVFLDRVKTKISCRVLFLEEIAANPSLGEKLFALIMTFAPAGTIERALGRPKPATLDDLATVIFSSGSTGEPKGVMLTHYNLSSNTEGLAQVLDLSAEDRLMGILPFFHSFGFTATLTAPAMIGLGVVYHPNPLDAKPIGELIRRYSITYLMATPTFLQIYLRSCDPADLGSLRCVMASAEKLPEWLATAFEEKFGIRPKEGYGCTECAPVITCSTHDYRAAGVRQLGTRRSSIGRPLPGVSVRIVDPDTGERLPVGRPGLLLVRGPNVMRGYLGQPDKTAAAMRDGWYVTGDIAAIDEEGFVQITDRLSRFSKIGGEMVPHVKVEEKLHEAAGTDQIVFAVCGIPDPKKGERLVVLHTLPEEQLGGVLKKLNQLGLPKLWTPRANQFFHVESLPLLATGKRDLRTVREIALRMAEASGPDEPET